MGAPKALLDAQRTRLLPHIIDEAKEDALATRAFLNTPDRLLLLAVARHGETVCAPRVRPSGLEVVGAETGADLLEVLELSGDEGAGLGRGGAGVEEGVDVGAEDVDDAAEDATLFLEDVHGLGGGDRAGEAGGSEARFGRADEAREVRHAAVVVEDGFVADDDHLNQGPVARGPADDFGDLGLRACDASLGDEHAEDELDVVLLGGRADVLESAAVGRVDSDGGESLAGNGGNVRGDGRGVFALARRGVWGVGHAPLVATSDGRGWRALAWGRRWGGGGNAAGLAAGLACGCRRCIR